MTMKTVLLGAAASVLALGAQAATPPELVRNGGFNDGLNFWSTSCSALPDGVCGILNGLGNPAPTFRGFDNLAPGTLTQTIAGGTPGIYLVRFDYASYDSNDPNRNSLTARLGTTSNISQDIPTQDNSFQSSSLLLANGAANPNLVFRFQTVAGSEIVLVDNVSVVQVDDGLGNNISAAAMGVAAESSRQFISTLFSRFGGAGNGTQALAEAPQETQVAGPGGASASNYRAWVSGRYGQSRFDDSTTRSNAQGVNLGFEFDATSNVVLGAALTVATLDYNTRTAFTRNVGYADEVMGALYGQWTPNAGPLYVSGLVGYGYDRSDIARQSLFGFGRVGANDVDTTQWFGALEAGLNWKGFGGVTLTPYARVEGGRVDQDGYVETSISGTLVPAVVGSTEADMLRTQLGARASTDFQALGTTWTLAGHAAWQHEFERDRNVAFVETAGFGTTFGGVTGAATPSRDAAAVGAALDVKVGRTANLFIAYDGVFGDIQESHAAQAGLRITW